MTEQSTQSIVIDADPASIMAVIADFDQYPAWAGSVKKAEVLERGPDGRARRVAFSLDAGVVRDEYELVYRWSGDTRVEWTLSPASGGTPSGALMTAQQGSYALEPVNGSTNVTYSLTVELAIPMLGQLKRKAERIVMDTALKELKRRVESAER